MLDFAHLKRGLVTLGILIFLTIIALLLIGERHKSESPKIRKGSIIDLSSLQSHLSQPLQDEKIVMVNFFSTWCEGCLMEHQRLIDMKKIGIVKMIGIAFQDDKMTVDQWLEDNGNPYDEVVYDRQGEYGVNWGIYGVPESFFVDSQGLVLFRHQGVLFSHHIEDFIKPLILNLKSEKMG